jgi:glucose-1-phosphate thymidylyltransferase
LWIVSPIAGPGRRLQPFTYSKPKAFLKIAGKKIIEHIMERLMGSFPVGTNILFIVGHKKKQVSEFLVEHYSNYFNIHFIEQEPVGHSEDLPVFAGLGQAIYLAHKFIKDDGMFVVLADQVPITDYSQILTKFKNAPPQVGGVINVQKVKTPEYYGVVRIGEMNNIKCLVEKPPNFVSDLAILGSYVFNAATTSKIFEKLAQMTSVPLKNGAEYRFTDVIQKIVKEGTLIEANLSSNEILDFDHLETLLEGNRRLLEISPANSGETSAQVEESVIIPPVYIGKNVIIKRSKVGPFCSIGDDVTLEECVFTDTVIGDGAELRRVISRESIIGDNVVLDNLLKDNIMIGDDSSISELNY